MREAIKMNTFTKKTLGLLAIALFLVVIMVYVMNRKGGVETEAVKLEPKPEEVIVAVTKPLEPASESVTASQLKPETITEETAGILGEGETQGEKAVEPDSQTGPVVKVKADQVLAIVNGVPLPANKVMLPSQFNKEGITTLPPEVLQEVLHRSIQRELILQKADVQGLVPNALQVAQLEKMYEHLTGNPLNLSGGWTIKNLDAMQNANDAIFHVRDKTARLMQMEFLEQAGEQDTAETRNEFREKLWNAATIELVNVSTATN